MEYRKEIDGLRALAVLPVLFFHAGLPFFDGGFVGVDVFFVISGYLITRVIHEEMLLQKFSIIHFYERRIRRLIPAMVLVAAACLPFAWFWMLPEELKDFGESLVAVNLFASNILFWLETDYFAAASELKPLLHTWSLAVEEQFYLVFPLLLLLLVRFRPLAVTVCVAVLVLLSLGLTQWLGEIDRSANFYLLPTRAWELGIGVLLALNAGVFSNLSRLLLNVFSAIGLVFIVIAIVWFDDKVLFPGFAALLPTLGTAMILAFATQQTIVGQLLSVRAVVLIGLISYSAYLWHQPLYAFARLRSAQTPSELTMLGLAALSLVLAYLTWRYVEAPFRNRKRFSRKQIFSYAAISWLILVSAGVSLHLLDGVPQRNVEAADIDFRIRHNRGLGRYCSVGDTGLPECRTSDQPNVVVWGDSYAKHLVAGILASKPDVKLAQLTKASCGPVPGVTVVTYPRFTKAWGDECIAFNNLVLNWLEQQQGAIKYAVLGSPFMNYLLDDSEIYTDESGLRPADESYVLKRFLATLHRLRDMGIKPVVFAPPLKTGEDIGACLKRRKFLDLNLDACDLTSDAIEKQVANARVSDFLLKVEKEFDVLWLPEMMCNTANCPSHEDGLFYYRDWGHLSVEASQYLGEQHDFFSLITE